MSRRPNLEDAYALSSKQDVKDLYSDWAQSYDTGFSDAQGYQMPRMLSRKHLLPPVVSVRCWMSAPELGWLQSS